VLKTAVLSRVRVEGWEHVIKRLFLALEKKPGKKSFTFFFIEQIVNCILNK
jgi:hypothetical protein